MERLSSSDESFRPADLLARIIHLKQLSLQSLNSEVALLTASPSGAYSRIGRTKQAKCRSDEGKFLYN